MGAGEGRQHLPWDKGSTAVTFHSRCFLEPPWGKFFVFCFFLIFFYYHLVVVVLEGEKNKEKQRSPIPLLPKHAQQPRLGQGKARNSIEVSCMSIKDPKT